LFNSHYRLCADQIATPALSEQLEDRPDDLPVMVEFVCRSVVGEEKAAGLADEVTSWIKGHLAGYSWPGNFRELEQCVRSYTIRKDYEPVRLCPPPPNAGRRQAPSDPIDMALSTLVEAIVNEKKSYDEIRRRIFTLVRRSTHTAKEAAKLLQCDSRTPKASFVGSPSCALAGHLKPSIAQIEHMVDIAVRVCTPGSSHVKQLTRPLAPRQAKRFLARSDTFLLLKIMMDAIAAERCQRDLAAARFECLTEDPSE
jgi:hypothetical protein